MAVIPLDIPGPLTRNNLAAEPRWYWPRSVYVHIPFCVHHCCYCDFAVVTGAERLVPAYLDALESEMRLWLSEPVEVETIYIGGGTPSLLPGDALRRLLEVIRRCFRYRVDQAEYSFEANPADVTQAQLELLASFGVNRLSIGAQSFQPETLRFLERQHDVATIIRAVELAQKYMASVSLDLIFAVPGQSLAGWHRDLDQALALGVNHLSTYNLTIEPRTALGSRVQRGLVRLTDEETERALYAFTMEYLASAGWDHYEISNFARPGHASRHNLVYWAGEAFFGFGLGAAGYVRGTRYTNTRSLRKYVSELRESKLPLAEVETLPPKLRAAETAALQLRRRWGINRPAFCQQTGFELDTLLQSVLRRHSARGWLEDDGTNVRLTREGTFYADSVCADCIAAVEHSSPTPSGGCSGPLSRQPCGIG